MPQRYTQGTQRRMRKRLCVAIGKHKRPCAADTICPFAEDDSTRRGGRTRSSKTSSHCTAHAPSSTAPTPPKSRSGPRRSARGLPTASIPVWLEPSLRRGTVIPRGMVGPSHRQLTAVPSAAALLLQAPCRSGPSMREHWCFSAGHGWSASQMVPCARGQAARRMLLLHAACSAAVPGGDACGRQA